MNRFLKIKSLIHEQNIHTHYYDIENLRKVISFSLYGNVEKYIGGLLENCKQINKIYPDFWIYVYLGNDFDKSILNDKFDNVKNLLFIETGKSGHEVMSYRFFSIDRTEVGISFSRDLDSIINLRDQYCINEFIKSDKKFQIIRDCKSHNTEILGGMWGIKKGLLNFKIEEKFNVFRSESILFKYGTDQLFLSKYIYPRVKQYALTFDEYFKFPGETPQKINAPIIYFPNTNGYDYVGRCANWGETYEIIK
jgi:hypothetical protein